MAYSSTRKTNFLHTWLNRLILFLIAALALVTGMVLSAVFLALFLVLALIGGGWLWWQRRHLRRQTQREQAEFIETEYEVLETRSRKSETDRERLGR